MYGVLPARGIVDLHRTDPSQILVAVEGENMRDLTVVVVEEMKSGDWGVDGKALSTADVKAIAAGVPTG